MFLFMKFVSGLMKLATSVSHITYDYTAKVPEIFPHRPISQYLEALAIEN